MKNNCYLYSEIERLGDKGVDILPLVRKVRNVFTMFFLCGVPSVVCVIDYVSPSIIYTKEERKIDIVMVTFINNDTIKELTFPVV